MLRAYCYACKFWYVLRASAAPAARSKPVFRQHVLNKVPVCASFNSESNPPIVIDSGRKPSGVNSECEGKLCEGVLRAAVLTRRWVVASRLFLPSTLTSARERWSFFWLQLDSSTPSGAIGGGERKTFRLTESSHWQLDASPNAHWAGLYRSCFCALVFIWIHTLMAQHSHPGPFSCLFAWLTPTTMQATPAQSPNWFQTFPLIPSLSLSLLLLLAVTAAPRPVQPSGLSGSQRLPCVHSACLPIHICVHECVCLILAWGILLKYNRHRCVRWLDKGVS